MSAKWHAYVSKVARQQRGMSIFNHTTKEYSFETRSIFSGARKSKSHTFKNCASKHDRIEIL
jgi:hypothetical protein